MAAFFGGPVKELFEKVAEKKLWSFLLLAVVGCLLNLPGTATLPLMDRDEPKFAQATWEMMETGQVVIPYFNQGYRFDKPPLTYWWMGVHYALMGKTEIAARLHSIVSGILTAYVIYLFGAFLYTRTAGLLSGLAWLACLQVLIHSRLCVADMPMMLGVTLTMYAVAKLLFSEHEPRRFGGGFWLLVGGLAVGFLAKGPVAWIVPALALLLWCWPVGRTRFPWRRLQPVWALVFATVLVGLWGVAALVQTRGAYWDVGMGDHVVKRGVSAFNGRVNVPIIYYLVTGIFSLLPWTAFLPGSLFVGRKELRADRKRSFLTAWFIAPFLVFALYATQLPHYVLPGFPALMLLLFDRGTLRPIDSVFRRRWFWSTVSLVGAIALLIMTAGLLRVFPEPMAAVNSMIVLAGSIIALVGVVMPLAIRWVRGNLSRWPVFLAVAVAAAVIAQGLTSRIREHHPIVLLERTGAFEGDEGVSYVAEGFAEPSWVFYRWNGNPWLLSGNIEQAADFVEADQNREGIFLTEEWRIGELALLARWKGEPVPYLRDQREMVAERFDEENYEITEISGLNIARTSWVRFWHVQHRGR